MKPQPSGLATHYSSVGERYDRLYKKLFGGNRKEVVRFLSDQAIGNSKTPLVVADIGGGTGQTIEDLKSLQQVEHRYILVEPFLKMAEEAMARKGHPDKFIHGSAEEFAGNAKNHGRFDVLICQEMIHHVGRLPEFFQGCIQLLKPGGRLAIVTRPVDVEFPFGKNGKRQWRESYAIVPEMMPGLLEKAGFHVETRHGYFPVSIDKRTWLECVGTAPLFSSIATLTPVERQEDLEELNKLPADLRFNDRMIFILGKKV